MPLRCLVFSSNEEMVQPIWQIFTDLGIEGEYCQRAVDAVERVTTQQFQIVITDWQDQPEAAFLLKTARDLKAAQRPLTLAIVSDEGRPEALKAGANSVLLKPIRPEQVRDTMSTACELLRAKQQPAAPQPVAQPRAITAQPEAPQTATMAAAASAGAVSASPSVPSSVSQAPEKTFRAGEFLQSPSSTPGAQFDTESEVDESIEQNPAAEVEALTELEPMAAAVEDAPAEPVEPQAVPSEPEEPLTGWAALQARLTRTAPPPVEDAPAKSDLLAYGETPSYGTAAESRTESKDSLKKQSHAESGSEAALFAHMPGEPTESSEAAPKPHSKLGRIFLVGILAAACVVLAVVPRARLSLRTVLQNAGHAGRSWLNPPPAPVPQAAPLHDSFGQSGDEYKLPTMENIPDATTDPSQVRVVPVVDPTAKPEKGTEANGGQAQAAAADNNHTDQNQAAPIQGEAGQSDSIPTGQDQAGGSPVKDPIPTYVAGTSGNAAEAAPVGVPSVLPVQPSTPAAHEVAPPQPRPAAPPVQRPVPPHAAGTRTGIPSSLKSQMASTAPASGGNKPPEAAMSSIEPVTLPESAVRDLLTQPVDPEYPAAARASGQRGSVVLQVLIGRDGTVQEAKFLQGSLVFARAAIDAVKQWRFKPYSMNGRPVSVQSVITLKFQPPA
jgi:protein TonB